MKVAWSSQRNREELGGAIYLMRDGREVEVCEVAEVPDDFVWPPKKQVVEQVFHVDDKFIDDEVPTCWRWGDLVFEGEVVKYLRQSPKAAARHREEDFMLDRIDDFGLMEEER